jgi:hypothetical protein
MVYETMSYVLDLGEIAMTMAGSLALLAQQGNGNKRPPEQHTTESLVVGYPPHLFPAHMLTQSGPLAELATIQKRLIAMSRQLSPQRDLSPWLSLFLVELREVMDRAYRVAVIAQVYAQPSRLETLVRMVQQIELEIVRRTKRSLIYQESRAETLPLFAHFASLRMFAQEMEESINW